MLHAVDTRSQDSEVQQRSGPCPCDCLLESRVGVVARAGYLYCVAARSASFMTSHPFPGWTLSLFLS